MRTRTGTGERGSRKQNLLAMLILALAVSVGAGAQRDEFGGWKEVRGQVTGFFHAEQIDGVWWLVTPEGNGFFSKGGCTVSYTADYCSKLGYAPYARTTAAKYGSAQKWAETTAARLRGWGLNTIGAWSSREMFEQKLPYTVLVGIAEGGGADWQHGDVADVFSPRFEQAARQRAQQRCAARAKDPFLLGYFTDNELRWAADWRSRKSLFESFLAHPAESAGKQAALRLIRARFESVEALNLAWETHLNSFDELPQLASLPVTNNAVKAIEREFLRDYARAYFKASREAIRAADPNHLILGCRFAGYAPEEVAEVAGEFGDAVSFNHYGFTPPADGLRKLYAATGKPVLLTEFSFKAADSGLPNNRGAGKAVATQSDRAVYFDRYVTALAQMPFLAGFHWFEYCDEPAEGRFDGENSNYGLVNIQDEPWTVLVERMRQVNAHLEETHQHAGKP